MVAAGMRDGNRVAVSMVGVKCRDQLLDFRTGSAGKNEFLKRTHLLGVRQAKTIKFVCGNSDTPVYTTECFIECRGIEQGREGSKSYMRLSLRRIDHVKMVLDHKAGIFQHKRIRNNRGNDTTLLLLG